MTAHELMIKTNHYLIKGTASPRETLLTDNQKENIVRQLLAARSGEREKKSFYDGVNRGASKYPGDGTDVRHMYPIFYIPPYNDGKKLQTVIPMSPKTHIFSANSYELEILRLLCLFAPENTDMKNMVAETLERLKTTCFGNGCSQGECFHSALPVIRFLAAVAPDETAWINKLIVFYNKHIDDKLKNKHIHGNTVWYFWLCLSELPFDFAKPEIEKYKAEILNWLTNKSCVMNSENDREIHPVLFCVLRNILSKYPEYEYIKNRQPYVNEKDGRIHFNMTKGELYES